MGIEVISNGTYQTLICNTSMTAFGPVFHAEDDVVDFIDWATTKLRTRPEKYCKLWQDKKTWNTKPDIRCLTETELIRMVDEWRNEKLDEVCDECGKPWTGEFHASDECLTPVGQALKHLLR